MPSTTTSRLSHLTAAWGLLFALLHAYWAAGGEAGMNGEPADTPAAQLYIAFIALLGLAGAGVALGLARGPRACSPASRGSAERRCCSASRSAPVAGCRSGASRATARSGS